MSAPYKKDFVGIIILMILAAVVTLLNPEVQKHLVDDVLAKGDGGMGVAFICLGRWWNDSGIGLPWNYVCAECGNRSD